MGTRWSELSSDAAEIIRAWTPIGLVSSPHLARVFGLSPQAIKNWRWRAQGPRPESSALYGAPPTPIYYRVSSVLAWLDGKPSAVAWAYERDWLLSVFGRWRFIASDGQVVDILAPLEEPSTRVVADVIRAKAKEFEAGLVVWPESQPRSRRPNLVAQPRTARTVPLAVATLSE